MVARDERRQLAAVLENFLAAPGAPLPDLVRPMVADSWRRSVALGVDPLAGGAPLELTDSQLREYRDQHPLSPMMPLIRRLLTENADEAGHIVAVGDAEGRLLWVEGHNRLRSRAEDMWFVEGALWSERGAGTNAPGTALALDAPVQIGAEEHFGVGVQSWSCVAAPVHDPLTGRLLGVIDLTGGPDVADPRSLALVRACAVAVEAGLMLQVGDVRSRPVPLSTGNLTLSGPDSGTLELPNTSARLSRRHTELVWLLSMAPNGLTAQDLDAALHESGSHLITVRAEINRLRRVLGGDFLQSRPYRLTRPVRTDVDRIRSMLAEGRTLDAVQAFTGPPLEESEAPAIRELSAQFVAELRQAVLDSRSTAVLDVWTAHAAGHDDAEAWSVLEQTVVPGSPRRALARAHQFRLRN